MLSTPFNDISLKGHVGYTVFPMLYTSLNAID